MLSLHQPIKLRRGTGPLPEPAVVGLAGLALLGTGALIAVSPVAAAAVLGLAFVALLLVHAEQLPRVFVAATAVVLVGYAVAGRGFAYVGEKPVFIGDVVLVIGTVALLTRARAVRLHPLHGLIALFMLLGALRTFPYVTSYGVNAIRDGALWGYCMFALALSAFVRIEHIRWAIDRYRSFVPWLVAWIPIAAAIWVAHASPAWPNSGIPMIDFKGGDMGVHLAIAASFVLLGLYSFDRRQRGVRSETTFWLLWFVAVAPVVAMSRSSILSIGFSVAAALVLRRSVRVIPFALTAAALFLILVVFHVSVPVGGGQNVSTTNLAQNVVSIVSNKQDQGGHGGSHQNLNGSKEFRLRWWTKIVDYTIHGPYFWKGKGFGLNLADSDGFQLDSKHTLRAPHNSHLTVLARMGVPGLVSWALLQLGFAATMLTWALRARRLGARLWAMFDAWLFVGWLAIMIDTSFDPYLEGPQGAIWLWSIVGVGIAAAEIQRREFSAGRFELERA
jgi:O-antigen ligase/polysaccharide polymerase Wzy-like membrane protein